MGYTKREIIDKINDKKDNIKLFYKQDFINYRGKTTDTDEYYTEIICEWIIENIHCFDGIPVISREKSYLTSSHTGLNTNQESNRTEELIAMEMYRQSKINNIGKILDYQTPLKNKRADKAGKIDLLSYDEGILRVLELKEPDSDENMLRCVIEGYTYLMTIDKDKLLKDFDLPENTDIKTNPFVFYKGKQYQEMQEDRPNLKKLISILGCNPFYYKKEDNKYIVLEE